MPDKKKRNIDRYKGFWPSWIFGPNEDTTRANMRQYDRERAECYAIIDERYGAEWYDIPISEREKLKIEIRKEAKQRCL